MNLKYLFFAASALAISACHYVSTDATLIDPTLHLARTCADGIKLYTVPDRVPRPYQEVALLSSVGKTSYSGEGDMIKSMREKAAKVGANGIILDSIAEPSALAKIAGDVAQIGAQATGQIATISAERKGKAMAIYVPGDSALTTAACARSQKS